MPLLDRFRHLVGPGVQWAVAYIGEAHASDTWPLKFSHERPTPTTLAQRAAYAVQCSSELGLDGFRLCVDGMANHSTRHSGRGQRHITCSAAQGSSCTSAVAPLRRRAHPTTYSCCSPFYSRCRNRVLARARRDRMGYAPHYEHDGRQLNRSVCSLLVGKLAVMLPTATYLVSIVCFV